MEYQPHFQKIILQSFGERGRAWLENLPALLEDCCQRWDVRLGEPYALSYNYVAPGMRADGSRVVFKVGVPHPELFSEMAALKVYAGRGVAQLLESDPEHGAMLLECVSPGGMLSELGDDDEATRILAGRMRRIWRPLTPDQARPFYSLWRWTAAFSRLRERYNGGPGPFPAAMLERAEGLRNELLQSQGEIGLLHGDLHHDNVLRAQREPWLVIDPKGLAGEREFEVGPLLYNPWMRILTWPDLKSIQARRVDILVDELGFDRSRVAAWGFVEAVLSMIWSLEEHAPDWDEIMPVAEAMQSLL
jgi:streptomycin 6-kinase